jgi:hypothetical protein
MLWYFFFYNKFGNFYTIFISLITVFLLNWWSLEYFFLGTVWYAYVNVSVNLNLLLINPLNKYHPGLFYITYLFIYTVVINFNFYYNYTHYYRLVWFKNIILKLNFFYSILFITLYFGG